jgi:hypothetical protein
MFLPTPLQDIFRCNSKLAHVCRDRKRIFAKKLLTLKLRWWFDLEEARAQEAVREPFGINSFSLILSYAGLNLRETSPLVLINCGNFNLNWVETLWLFMRKCLIAHRRGKQVFNVVFKNPSKHIYYPHCFCVICSPCQWR